MLSATVLAHSIQTLPAPMDLYDIVDSGRSQRRIAAAVDSAGIPCSDRARWPAPSAAAANHRLVLSTSGPRRATTSQDNSLWRAGPSRTISACRPGNLEATALSVTATDDRAPRPQSASPRCADRLRATRAGASGSGRNERTWPRSRSASWLARVPRSCRAR